MRRSTIAAVVAAAAVLSGGTSCSKAFEELSAEDLCAMVKPERVEKLFGIAVEDVVPIDSGADSLNFSSCVYDAERDQPLRQASIMAEALTQGPVGKDALDDFFTSSDREQHDYEAVDGLGDMAGFGPNPRSAPGVTEYEFAVVDGDYAVRVFAAVPEKAKTEVTVDQLRPLAEAVLDKWERS